MAVAAGLGFHRVGVAAADSERRHAAYRAWIEAELHGEMAYLAEPGLVAARATSESIAAGARSIICVALAYDHRDPAPTDDELRGRVARYARGDDYHHVIKERLAELADALAREVDGPMVARAVTDTAPLLERALAERAGLGFVGKNTMLISPGLGSYTLLGELLTTIEIAPTGSGGSGSGRCGECRACLEACPTDAFPAPFVLDATRCISYLTIEHRGSIPRRLRPALGKMVFGCDICQDVCPYNAAAPDRNTPAPRLSSTDVEIAFPRLVDLLALRSSSWKRLAGGRAIKRATRRGMIRNAAVALGNSGNAGSIAALTPLLADDSEMIREHAAWALVAIAKAIAAEGRGEAAPDVVITCRDYLEADWAALCEVHDLARLLELDRSGLAAAFLTLEVTAAPEGLFSGRLRVAEIDGVVVGFASSTREASVDEIAWLYVHPRWQRRGVGARLLDDALAIVGAREARVSLLAENEPARALYASRGFAAVESRSGTLVGNEAFAANGIEMRRGGRRGEGRAGG